MKKTNIGIIGGLVTTVLGVIAFGAYATKKNNDSNDEAINKGSKMFEVQNSNEE